MFLTMKERVDSLCDYTYTFTLKNFRLRPDSIIPPQQGTDHTFKDLVDELKSGGEVRIRGGAGRRLVLTLSNSGGLDILKRLADSISMATLNLRWGWAWKRYAH